MDKIKSDNASVNCKNIFISGNADQLKENLTQKMAELINEQERTKQVHVTNDE